jgi:hypothetical protein
MRILASLLPRPEVADEPFPIMNVKLLFAVPTPFGWQYISELED